MIKKNKNNIIAGIFIILAIMANTQVPYIANNDELWTFANTYKLYNGISLYNENNVIVTPLFFWIGNIFFKLIVPNFLTYKIYNLVLAFCLYICVYKLLNYCNIKHEICIIATIIFIFLYKIIIVGANYTTLVLIFFVLGVLNLIKNKEKNPNIIFQGIITFLILLTKQNIAVYYLLAVVVYLFTKENRLKNILKLGLYIAIPTLIFIGYEYYIGELYNFINYAFGGIGEFAQNNIIIEGYIYTQIEIAFQIASVIIAIVQIKENSKNKIKDETLKILLIFSIANIMFGYPIFNRYHVSTGIIIPSILFIYVLYQYIKRINIKTSKEILDNLKRTIKYLGTALILILTCININIKYNAFKHSDLKFSLDEPFYGGIIYKEESDYNEVMKFIKDKIKEGHNVIIFNTRANLYMLPLGLNNKDYDLPMLGNWGKNGENRILEDIKNKENTYFLTYDEKRNITTQESVKIKNYIKENLKNEGSVGKYDIFYATEK